jgi:3-hydroxyisobutyrate dehydrogenase
MPGKPDGGKTRRNGMAGVGGSQGQQAEKLGYLGLGMMGFPMTRRLLNAGHDVTVWNRSPGKAAGLVEAGATPATHPCDVAAAASIIFMCLTDAAAVEEVVFGPDGLATAAAPESSSLTSPRSTPTQPAPSQRG